jgi:hypothetical protein
MGLSIIYFFNGKEIVFIHRVKALFCPT